MNESTQPKAKKSLGQHFLRHESICNRIASLLLPKDTDNVIEIGPGPGALTRAIEASPMPGWCCWKRTATGPPSASAWARRVPRPC